MSETISTNQHFYTKDFNGYRNTEDNFVANQELTVTITLNEYRSLISENATYDKKVTELYSKNHDYMSQIERLKEKIYKLQNEDDEEDNNDHII